MNERHKTVLFVAFISIFALTAFLTLAGLAYIWFISPSKELLFLKELLCALILEVVAIVIYWAKSAHKNRIEEYTFSSYDDVNKFLRSFYSRGSNVNIVSNNASWLVNNRLMQQTLNDIAENGVDVAIHLASVPADLGILNTNKIKIYSLGESKHTSRARFTMLNTDMFGSEVVAIGVGAVPEHKIYIISANTNPSVIAMAYDLISLNRLVAR